MEGSINRCYVASELGTAVEMMVAHFQFIGASLSTIDSRLERKDKKYSYISARKLRTSIPISLSFSFLSWTLHAPTKWILAQA